MPEFNLILTFDDNLVDHNICFNKMHEQIYCSKFTEQVNMTTSLTIF